MFAGIGQLIDSLGGTFSMAKLMQLAPLASRKSDEFSSNDVLAIANAFGITIEAKHEPLVAEIVNTVRTSEFNRLADVLSNEEYVAKITLMLSELINPMSKRLREASPFVTIQCPICDHDYAIERSSVLHVEGDVLIQCPLCQCSSEVDSGILAYHGV